jgi:hypothetical protein
MSISSSTPARAFFTLSESVMISRPSVTGVVHAVMGFFEFDASTRHMRQFPAGVRPGW